ncbi:MAG: hypothetical protein Kow00103_15380 [Candidatus Caldatribacteriota bacterium]
MKELQLIIALPSPHETISEGEINLQHLGKFVFQLVKIIIQDILSIILQALTTN